MSRRTPNKLTYPKTWTEKYSNDDKAMIHSIIDWLNDPSNIEKGWTRTLLARQATISSTTFHQIMDGTYPSPPTSHLKKAVEVMQHDTERHERGVGIKHYVETSVYKAVLAACKRAHIYRGFAVVSAFVGTGKTTAVDHYAEQHESAVLIKATPDMTAAILLAEIVELVGAVVHKSKYTQGTKAEKMRAIIAALKGTDRLLILDEAETVTPQCLEFVRRISDMAEVGVVLSGTERLKPLIKDPRGRFGQISSRVIFWPSVIKSITELDANALTRAALKDDDVELTDEVLDAFWQMCDGSARVLCKSLIPGVRDYGLKKGEALTPELVFKVGSKLLGFERPKKPRGK